MSLPWATVGPVPSGAAMRGAKRDALVRRPPAAPRLSASAAPPPADARVAAWPRPRRFNLPALGECKLRRGAPHLSLHTGGGRRDRDAARITGRARCGRMDAARTYCCRCGGGMRRRTANPADRDIDGRGLTDRLARHPLQGGKRGFEREVDLVLGFGCETRRRRDSRLCARVLRSE